jgi:hypothetical protein
MSLSEGKKKFFVGQPRPKDAILGQLENDRATIKGISEQLGSPIGGKQIIPNRSIVWGIRLDKDGRKPKDGSKIQAIDKNYNGKVDFSGVWGTEGGIPITTRYKSGCTSIDYDYQVLQLGMPKFENDTEENYLDLPFGEYVIFDSEEAKQLMIETHHENIDSICKNPEVLNGSIRLVKSFESTKDQVKSINREFEATKIVNEATTFEHLKVIQHILATKKDIRYDESDEVNLYESILLYARQEPDTFLGCVKTYDIRVSEVIEKFRSYKAYDWTTDGTLKGGQDKKELILNGIDAKGEDMVQYLFDNRMQPEVFDAINRMTVIAQKFK